MSPSFRAPPAWLGSCHSARTVWYPGKEKANERLQQQLAELEAARRPHRSQVLDRHPYRPQPVNQRHRRRPRAAASRVSIRRRVAHRRRGRNRIRQALRDRKIVRASSPPRQRRYRCAGRSSRAICSTPCPADRCPTPPPEEWAFLDTETTGLSGGTGTCAFLVGVGRITPRRFPRPPVFHARLWRGSQPAGRAHAASRAVPRADHL